MADSRGAGPYRVVPFRPERNATLDTLRWARRRLTIPILLEVDVTDAREAIRAHRSRSGTALSFTAWVVRCVARAAAEHPRVHAARRGGQLVLFDEVDVAVVVERELGEDTLPMPCVVRGANEKPLVAIHEEIRSAQEAAVAGGAAALQAGPSPRLQSLFFRLPGWLRDLLFWRWLVRSPTLIKQTMGTVVVTAAGMAAPGVLAWGVPLSLHPLAIGVGGIARRGTGNAAAEVLALTVVFDHAVVDGAPVGRFVRCLHELLAGADGLPRLAEA
jgi:pyruvate/2-oxoglutarate dehydrogenase complex dihydrolipoamide acyltransferase (E2) component